MNIGDKVRVIKIPDDLPADNTQLQTLFRGCLNKTFTITGFDGDLLELHVGEAFGKSAEHHQIWLEPTHVKLIEV
ncbi:MAG: hypothetical protein ACKVP4_13420 [Hyphomicrobium sp.]